jgi:uncharacterized membrane protein (DUF2068 family)
MEGVSTRSAGAPSRLWLVLIAIFKLVKCTALVMLGLLAFRLVHGDAAETMTGWLKLLAIDPENRFIHPALMKLGGLSPKNLEEVGIGAFIYAAVFLTEGTGLLLGKRWGEYLTIGVTLSFIPFEIYEAFERPTALRLLAIAINAAVVVYLVWRVRRERSREHVEAAVEGAAQAGATPVQASSN